MIKVIFLLITLSVTLDYQRQIVTDGSIFSRQEEAALKEEQKREHRKRAEEKFKEWLTKANEKSKASPQTPCSPSSKNLLADLNILVTTLILKNNGTVQNKMKSDNLKINFYIL